MRCSIFSSDKCTEFVVVIAVAIERIVDLVHNSMTGNIAVKYKQVGRLRCTDFLIEGIVLSDCLIVSLDATFFIILIIELEVIVGALLAVFTKALAALLTFALLTLLLPVDQGHLDGRLVTSGIVVRVL